MATAKVARTGIQLYRGAEVDRPDLDVVRVMRPEEEVFNKDSLASFVGKPMTNEHPAKPVSAESWKTDAIGSIGEGVLRDGDYISVPLVMMDASAIKDFENGKRELSMGYDAEIEFVDHADYDAIQKISALTTLRWSIKAVQVVQELATRAAKKQSNKPNWRSQDDS